MGKTLAQRLVSAVKRVQRAENSFPDPDGVPFMQARFSVTSNSPAPEAGIGARVLNYALLLGSAAQFLKIWLRRWAHAHHTP